MSKQSEVTNFVDIISTMVDKNKENSQIKNIKVFDYKYIPPSELFLWRSEMQDVAEQLVTYLHTGLQQNVLVVGSRGSGKTVSMQALLQELKKRKEFKEIYINTRECCSSFSVYERILGEKKDGSSSSELRQLVTDCLGNDERVIIILDEVEFMKDNDIFYHLSRNSKATMIILTQKPHWYYERLDESIRSSLQPKHIIFNDYSPGQLEEIFEKRAQEGLCSWNKDGLARLAALNARDYLSDVRVGLRALLLLGVHNDWSESAITEACKNASKDVEEYLVRGLKDTELIILASLLKDKDTNKAFKDTSTFLLGYGLTLSKRQFFRIFNHLQNIDLVFSTKKRKGRYHTFETASLLYNDELVRDEMKIRFKSK